LLGVSTLSPKVEIIAWVFLLPRPANHHFVSEIIPTACPSIPQLAELRIGSKERPWNNRTPANAVAAANQVAKKVRDDPVKLCFRFVVRKRIEERQPRIVAEGNTSIEQRVRGVETSAARSAIPLRWEVDARGRRPDSRE
jgi:hypothetical protein